LRFAWCEANPRADEVTFGQGHGAFDDVFELAHIAGPVVGEQHLLGALLPASDRLARPLGRTREEVVGQRKDVLLPAAQGRQLNLDDVQR